VIRFTSVALVTVWASIAASGFSQCAVAESNGQCFLSSVGKYDPSYTVSPSLAPVPVPAAAGEDDRPPMAGRAVGIIGGGYVAAKVGYGVAAEAASVAHVGGRVGNIPVYGSAIKSIPVIGTATAHVGVPTTLGQMPFIGGAVADIPVVGSVIAGPPNPLVVGAVSIDTFVLPKLSPTGYTESSIFTMTDFNSPPRLRHYVNYLAPLPYTHPPIYEPAARGANELPKTARAEGVAAYTAETVSLEN
jgi:hypothetical protein